MFTRQGHDLADEARHDVITCGRAQGGGAGGGGGGAEEDGNQPPHFLEDIKEVLVLK